MGGAAIGLIAGYYAVAYISCMWLWPKSNLAGFWQRLQGWYAQSLEVGSPTGW
jgi:hypothetical protein